MHKKQFVNLALCIREFNAHALRDYPLACSEHHQPFSREQIAALATFCREQNPDFNQTLWLAIIAGTMDGAGK